MYRTLCVIAGSLLIALLLSSSALAMDEADLAQIRAAIEAKGAHWTAGDNPIFRLSREEQRRLCGAIEEPLEVFQANARMNTPVRKDTPDALDWRNYEGANYITPIRNQAGCGSCVAFGTLATFEGRIQIVQNQPGTDLDLSEQHIFSCGGGFCDYGWGTSESHDYLQYEGAPLESCLPYQAVDVDCEAVTCSDWQQQARKILDWGNVPYSSPAAGVANIKTALMDGPVACSYTVYDDFMSYNGGVYEQTWGEVAGGHCVSIIGWSDADSCWICKNSWGPGWGEDGFFRIRMGTNEVGIEDYVRWMTPAPAPGYVSIENYTIMDQTGGNGDGVPDPGEAFDFTLTLSSPQTYASLTDLSGFMVSTDPRVSPINVMTTFPDLPDGGTCVNDQTPFSVQLSEQIGIAPIEFNVYLNGTADGSLPYSKEATITMPLVVDHPGWPVNTAAGMRCSPLMVWYRGGPRRLLSLEDSGRLHMWEADGQEVPAYSLDCNGQIWGSAAMGDLNGDGRDDIVFGSKNDTLYALNHHGGLLFKRNMGADILGTPAIADLESDGTPEIVVGTMSSEIHVLTNLGEKKTPFPIVLGGPVMADAALADLDGDGTLDIMVGTQTGDFYALNAQTGMPLDGFPVSTGGAIWSGPVVADLDKNGSLEVIFGSDDKHLYAINPDGSVLWDYRSNGAIRSSPAIADINGDSRLDVIFTAQDGGIYAVTHQGIGIYGWPYHTGKVLWSSPAIVDIDSDGALEAVVTVPPDQLVHIDTDGSLLLSVPMEASGIPMSSPVVGDLDNDGDLEIATGSTEGVHIYDYSTVSTVDIAWPMYRGCARRTGYVDDVTTAVPEDTEPQPAMPHRYVLHQNYPNPFNPETTIRYALAQDGQARLAVYNVLGQEVVTLVNRQQPAGPHEIVWNGTDGSGLPVSSGLYFYRLQAGEFSETRKMVLLR